MQMLNAETMACMIHFDFQSDLVALEFPVQQEYATIRYAYMQFVPLTRSFFPSSSYVVYLSLFCNPCLSL